MPETFEQKIRSYEQTTKKQRALRLAEEIESIIIKKKKKSVEDYKRIIGLLEEIKKIYGVKKIKNVIKNNFNEVMVALLDETHEVISLGIIEKIDFANRKIYIYIPKENLNKNIKIIQFGSLKLSLDIKEAGFVEPGSL